MTHPLPPRTAATSAVSTSRRALLIGGSAALVAGCTSGSAKASSTPPSTSAASISAATTTSPQSSSASSSTETTTPSSTTSVATPTTDPAAGVKMPGLAPVGTTPFPAYSAVDVPADRITAAIAAVDGLVADVMSRSGLPGMAVAVVSGGKVVYAKGFGVREVGKPDKITTDTVFQIASCSKSLGSTAVAWAVTQGKLTWADEVTKHLPAFKLSDPAVTSMLKISDCYTHRTGLPGAAGDDLEGFGFDRDEILQRIAVLPLNPFRITYNYTNFGLTIGGEAAAAATGMSWEDLQQEALYKPLGMTSTSSRHSDYLARANRAVLHFPVNGKFEPRYVREPDAQSPAGGVSSSVSDMAKWLLLNLDDGKVNGTKHIDPAVLQEVHNAHIASEVASAPDDRSRFYGYGFNNETTSSGHVRWGHSGAFYVGAATAYGIVPAAGTGIVVLTNGAPVGAAETVAYSFTDLVRTGVVERDWYGFYSPLFKTLFVNNSKVAAKPPATPAKPRSAAAYVGTYSNDYVGDVVISAQGERLTLTLGPKKLHATLTPWNGDIFSWLAPGGNGDPVTAVTFSGNSGGKATAVNIELLLMGDLKRKA